MPAATLVAVAATAPTTTSSREGHCTTIRAASRRDTLRITPDEVEEAKKEAKVILKRIIEEKGRQFHPLSPQKKIDDA